MKVKDQSSIMWRIKHFLADRRAARRQLQHGPRTLAEALRDSGALSMPGRSRLTGGW